MADLIAYTTTRYRCPHCRKSYAAKGTAERHLVRCWRNPERRACLTCKHRDHGEYGEPECSIGEGAWPCCNECGSSRRDEDGRGFCGHYSAGEARYLQVLCPAWEAKSDG